MVARSESVPTDPQILNIPLDHSDALEQRLQSGFDRSSDPLESSPSVRREAALRQGLTAAREPLPPRQRKLKAGTTSFMLAMHVGAVFALLPRFWSLQGLIVLAVLYWITVLGVTLGLHRLVAHRGFDAPRWLERLLVLMGAMACQSGPIEWVGLHRHHHLFSDQPNDHHDAARGLWWAHSEWMLHDIPALREIHRFTGETRITGLSFDAA